MKRMLQKNDKKLYFIRDNVKIFLNQEKIDKHIYPEVKIRGNVSNISGDVSDISGNIDDCNITNEERKKGININDLVK